MPTDISSIRFGPRMESRITGFAVEDLKWRAWGGLAADLWDVKCMDGAQGDYLSPDPRLFVPLAIAGEGTFLLRDEHRQHRYGGRVGGVASYIPAGHATQGEARGRLRLRHLDLHMSEAGLVRRFGRALSRRQMEEPRLSLCDTRLAALTGLLADALDADEPCHDLYLDGLANALLAVLFDIRQEEERRRPAVREGGAWYDGVTAGAGVRYPGSSWADNENTLKVPDATLVDLKLGYEKDNWGVALNVTNVFDETYVSSCQGASVCSYGEGRSFKLKAHARW